MFTDDVVGYFKSYFPDADKDGAIGEDCGYFLDGEIIVYV